MLKAYSTDFLAYCKVADFAEKSIQSLRSSLRELNAFADTVQITAVEDIAYNHLSEFVADFKQPSVHKKKARVWCLHQFFHFLTVSGHVEKNIALGIPYPKIEKTIPYYLTIEELNRMIEFFSHNTGTATGCRDLVIILMLGLLGLRTSSIIGLNVEHIDIFTGLAWITEKGRRQRNVVLPELLVTLLENYIAELDHDTGPLFHSTRKKRISSRSLHDIFRSAADNLGINKRLHAQR